MHGTWFVELYLIYTIIYREPTMLLVLVIIWYLVSKQKMNQIWWWNGYKRPMWPCETSTSAVLWLLHLKLLYLGFIFDLGFTRNQFSIAFIGNIKDILKYWKPLTQPNKNNGKLITFLCQLKHIKLHGRNSCSQRIVSGPLAIEHWDKTVTVITQHPVPLLNLQAFHFIL